MSGPYGFEPGGVELAGVELAGIVRRGRQIYPKAFDTAQVAPAQLILGGPGRRILETIPADEQWVLGRDDVLSFV